MLLSSPPAAQLACGPVDAVRDVARYGSRHITRALFVVPHGTLVRQPAHPQCRELHAMLCAAWVAAHEDHVHRLARSNIERDEAWHRWHRDAAWIAAFSRAYKTSAWRRQTDGWSSPMTVLPAAMMHFPQLVVRLFTVSSCLFVTTNHTTANFVCTNEKGVMGVTHGRQPSCSPSPPLRLPRTESRLMYTAVFTLGSTASATRHLLWHARDGGARAVPLRQAFAC